MSRGDDSFWSFYSDDPGPEDFGAGATWDMTPGGALMLQYEKDDAFTAVLRDIVPQGLLTWQRNPFCWVIDGEYKDDVLKAANTFFDWVRQGDIE